MQLFQKSKSQISIFYRHLCKMLKSQTSTFYKRLCFTKTFKKYRLGIGTYHLPGLKEIVVPVATANIMALRVTKAKNFPMA
jgi:hypothetical protein